MRRIPAATPDSEIIRNKPISPVRCTWVPPQSSTEKPSPIVNTRTLSPYFSPKSAIAPLDLASFISHKSVCTAELIWICWLTRLSISFNWFCVTASKCEKSKRKRSESTNEPFWVTCSPKILRSAACIRCVAEWFNAVAWRTWLSTRAVTLLPTEIAPSSTFTRCKCAAPCFWQSPTSIQLLPNSI